GTFANIAVAAGVGDVILGQDAASGDIDNDGYLDLYEVMYQPHRLYRNDGGIKNWLHIRLVGTQSNRDGIGARITLDAGALSQIREVNRASGMYAQESLIAEFGLANYAQADSIEVEWPSGVVQTLTNVSANQLITVVEPSPFIYVDAANTSSIEDGTQAFPYNTIQEGIDAASNGNTVFVADAVYTGAGNKDLDFYGKSIIVTSLNGPANCIIDCENAGRGFYFHSGEGSDSVVSGFTIMNGDSGGNTGGGIRCINSAPTIEDNVITGNHDNNGGGGIYFGNSSAIIRRNVISNNTSDNGGGIYCNGNPAPTIENNTIAGNTATGSHEPTFGGGGIYTYNSSPMIVNNTIIGNSDPNGGGGIAVNDFAPTAQNNIIWGNTGGQIRIVTGSINVTYCCVQGSWPGTGNISDDPLLVDASNGDYHLLDYSSCIGAGTNSGAPEEDIEGNPRPNPPGSSCDMGAYENPLGTHLNASPVVSGLLDVVFLEDETNSSIDLDDYVHDPNNGDGEIAWAHTGNTNVSVSIDSANHVVTFGALANWNGSEEITFTATDPDGLSGSDSMTVTVTPVNDAPVISDIPDVAFVEDGSDGSIDLDDYVDNVDNADAELILTHSGNTDVSVFVDDTTHIVTFTATSDWSGSEDITFTATDPGNLSDSDTMTVTVTAANDPPVASNPAIMPPLPEPGNDLQALYNYADVEGDPESGSLVKWYRDGNLQPEYDNMLILPFNATLPEEAWSFSVEPGDGISIGELVQSNPVTIGLPTELEDEIVTIGYSLQEEQQDEVDQEQEPDEYTYINDQVQSLIFGLNWGGSSLILTVYPPNSGTPLSTDPNAQPPVTIVVQNAEVGDWLYTITPVSVPFNNYPYVAQVGETNEPPTVEAGGPYSVNEGSSIEVTASGSDPNNDPITFTWDLDNDGSFETEGQSVSFSAVNLNGPSSHDIAVQVTDSNGLTAVDQATVNVVNVAPTVSVLNDGPKDEGTAVTVTVSQTDPGTSDIFTYSFDWDNDGTYDIVDQPAASASYTWYDNDSYTVTVRVKDNDGGEGTATTVVQVDNVAPTASVSNVGPQGEGTAVTVTASQTDPGTGDTFTYSFDWESDGTYDIVEQSEPSSSYTWYGNGSYTVTVRVKDNDGGEGTATTV
ncbi:PKD domain-containing protein, partial [Candidatus Poribacteria bacterium]